jgi:hypothetical protein
MRFPGGWGWRRRIRPLFGGEEVNRTTTSSIQPVMIDDGGRA